MPRALTTVIVVALLLTACAGADASGPLNEGRSVYGNVCSACHGSAGQGGVGPALEAVNETFPDCRDQIEWITLGSDEWAKLHGGNYGSLGAPVKGGMPSHAKTLTSDEIASVAAFERSAYGGLDEQTAAEQCGVQSADE